MPRKTGRNEVAIQTLPAEDDIAEHAVLPISLVADDRYWFAKHRIADELLGVVSERLPAFRCVDAVEPDADDLVLNRQKVDRIAIGDADLLAGPLGGIVCGEPPPPNKRPTINVFAAIMFVFIPLFFLMCGSVVESGEAFLVQFAGCALSKRRCPHWDESTKEGVRAGVGWDGIATVRQNARHRIASCRAR